ncbi:MAG TPA: sigma 54-interacting transcriptional regulator [Blastocatellia bacterium]|nr:sigma 54-interacting transcriptional regulator [Blastocatellia bacterium]
MKPEDLKIIELLQIDEQRGTIQFENRRMLIFDADAMGLLRKEMIDALGHRPALRILARFGYARGYRDAMTLKEMYQWETLEDWWKAGPKLHALEGITASSPVVLELDPENGVFHAEGIWTSSYEAEQHFKHIGLSDTPVCWTLTGYASGYSSAVFGSEVFYWETECVGKGDSRCYVVGKSIANQEAEAARAAATLYKFEDFEDQLPTIVDDRVRMQRLLAELDRQSKDLAAERDRVQALESQVFYLQEAISGTSSLEEMVGASLVFRRVLSDVERVAGSDTAVLITGETGTGKEMIARAIHKRSLRKSKPLVTVNCAALPAGLVESELFGHEKGAFTGAVARKLGRFELANNATIFLDEVGELPLETQAKFLRVLQHGEFERVGGAQTIRVDARVIAATNRDLSELVAEGKYRSDLFYRLNVFPIDVPPLRERGEDIVLLTNYFAQKFRNRFRKNITSISQASIDRLLEYGWPGNVRELEHIVERAVLLSEGEVLEIELPIPTSKRRGQAAGTNFPTRLVTLDEVERDYISRVLRETGWVIAGKGGAAEILGLPASTLRSRMKKLSITR